MGRRKHDSAEARKEAKKTIYMAKLVNNPTSPRKTRLVADLIRGLDVYLQQLGIKYVLFLVASVLTDIFVMMCFAIIMIPNSSQKRPPAPEI